MALGSDSASSARRTTASSAAGATTSRTSTLPGMLHIALLRSPFAHARINSIDTSRPRRCRESSLSSPASCWPQHNLAWMPTLSGDTQAVLATDKVRFQGQEVAGVVAENPYIAHDALELIDVDYEPLPAVDEPQQALAADAPLIRDDKEGQDRQPHLPLGGGRQGGDRPRVRGGRPRRQARHPLPALRIRRRSSAAAASPTSTRRPARRRST